MGQCLCVRSKYNVDEEPSSDNQAKQITSRDIFFFADGSVIFWNVPQIERESVLNFLRKAQTVEDEPFDEDTIFEESEMMSYELAQNTQKFSKLDKGVLKLKQSSGENGNTRLAKYSFSNAIAASVKLGMFSIA